MDYNRNKIRSPGNIAQLPFQKFQQDKNNKHRKWGERSDYKQLAVLKAKIIEIKDAAKELLGAWEDIMRECKNIMHI